MGACQDGQWASASFTSVKEFESLMPPVNYILYQSYPNPFNPSTNISFSIPKKSYIILKVFDIIGREVETLANQELSAGNYTRQFFAYKLPSGIYFYRLQAGAFTQTKKFILLK